MAKNISMYEIAKLFNVSKVTVSKALNDKPGVSEKLREEIKEKAAELGYRMNIAAKSLKTNKSYNVGVLIAERYIGERETYYFGVYGKLATKFSDLGYSTIMETLSYESELNLKLPQMYLELKVDAIIVLGQLNTDYLKLFNDCSIPVLYFDFYANNSNVDSVVVDNFYSGLQITQYLIDRGHKEVGFIGNLYATSSIQDRFLGYYRCLLENKLQINYDYVISDRDETGNFIDIELPNNLPTAFVCNCDQVAFYLIKKLKENNISVPNDISVVSFDNTIYSTVSEPQITTLDNNVDEMVKVATKIILKKIETPERRYDRVLIKAFIVERDSVKEL